MQKQHSDLGFIYTKICNKETIHKNPIKDRIVIIHNKSEIKIIKKKKKTTYKLMRISQSRKLLFCISFTVDSKVSIYLQSLLLFKKATHSCIVSTIPISCAFLALDMPITIFSINSTSEKVNDSVKFNIALV